MKWRLRIVVIGIAVLSVAAAPPQTSSKHSSRPAAKASAASSTARRKSAVPASPRTGTRTVSARGASRAAAYRASRGRLARASRYSHVAPAPSYQIHPDPDRYRQIQQALADRGYFKGEVNGTWGDDSADAMRRFQYDQKLDDDGKITSLSLIGLGLGPRHDGLSAAPPATLPASSTPSGGIAPAPPSADPAPTTAQVPPAPSQPRAQ